MNPGESKKTVVSVGPFGLSKERGKPFDDGIHSAVKGLVIFHVPESAIAYVQFEYDDDGISTSSDKHGDRKIPVKYLPGLTNQDVPFRRESIRFNYPDEFLTSVHGYCQEDWTGSYVTSLAFKTNRKAYGPFGSTQYRNPRDCFTIHVPGSKIVGFHGRSNNKWLAAGIASIGAYLKPPDQQIEYPPSTTLKQVGYPSQTKLEKDDRPQYQKHYTIQDIRVNGNQGNHNGAFYLGDKYIIYNGPVILKKYT